jgi:hypothetical protein
MDRVMRLLLLKLVLSLLLLNGAMSSYANAASLAYEFSRVSSNSVEDLGRQLSLLITEQPQGALFTFSNRLGVPSLITNIYFDDAQSALFSSIVYQADSGPGFSSGSQTALANLPDGSLIGFLASFSGDANAQSVEDGVATKRDLHVQAIGLAAHIDSYVGQPSPVPLSAAAWLFASALFGFIVVASRRKA